MSELLEDLLGRYAKARGARSFKASREVRKLIDDALLTEVLNEEERFALRTQVLEIDATSVPLTFHERTNTPAPVARTFRAEKALNTV